MTGVGLALLAGLLSTLSPCVLPLVPIVIGTALGEHRHGPIALAAGLALSFVVIGLFVATVGFAAGLDQSVFRFIAAVFMILIGAVLLVPRLQLQFAAASGPVGNWAQNRIGGLSPHGLRGQFAVGLLLGAVWTPCVGPTLGAASLLAAQSENLAGVGLTMFVFGVGAAIPLLAIGMLSREALARWLGRLLSTGSAGRALMGVVFVALGALVLAGIDKQVEAFLVDVSPDWLTALTTRF